MSFLLIRKNGRLLCERAACIFYINALLAYPKCLSRTHFSRKEEKTERKRQNKINCVCELEDRIVNVYSLAFVVLAFIKSRFSFKKIAYLDTRSKVPKVCLYFRKRPLNLKSLQSSNSGDTNSRINSKQDGKK